METLRTRLLDAATGAGLPGWRLEAQWRAAASDPVPNVPARRAAISESDGAVSLDVPVANERSGAILFAVSTPDGVRVNEANALDSEWKLTVPPPAPVDPIDPSVATSARLSGRVIDTGGRGVAAGTPLLIMGRLADGDPAVTLAHTIVASAGYFRTDRPQTKVVHAWARVGGVDASPLPLDPSGLIEPRAIIVVSRPLSESDDCSCEQIAPRTPEADDLSRFPERFSTDVTGRCVDMTFPNRVVEEVLYQKVVRVTEPDIQGLTTAPVKIDAPTRDRIDDLIHGTRTTTTKTNLRGDVAARLFSHPQRVSPATFAEALHESVVTDLDAAIRATAQGFAGRVPMDSTHAVDWDDTPTVFQAVTAAHGHLLRYRQVWRADGYSLGDLLYSLPLAPGQKKLISILDWARTEESAREEWTSEQEQLQAFLERDRDVVEIVDSHLRETGRGGSSANVWGGGGGIGVGAIGGPGAIFAGVAGGGGGSSSTSWQNSGRRFAAESMQSIRDGTIQGASAVRSTRSTVIQTDLQTERAQAVTEVIVNYNHCHALTIEYFEVLRHFTVTHELAGVDECLFVPLPMAWFDQAKALRWREPLSRFLRERALRDGFAAAERVAANWEGYDTPERSFAEEAPEVLEGELWISFVIPRPRDAEDGKFQVADWRWAAPLLPVAALELWTSKLNQRQAAERDLVFRREVAPGIAASLVDRLRFSYVTVDGSVVDVPLDTTLVSRYTEGTPLYVTLRAGGSLPNIPREEIQRFRVRIDGIEFPEDARILVHKGKVRYETEHLQHLLFNEPKILNDLAAGDEVLVPTPLSFEEMRDPRQEDRDLAERLVRHLNDHLEFYHQIIWMTMDPARRYLLLDGFQAPNANGRSLASVVENRVIGIVGNCLLFPVSPGNVLAPPLRDEDGNIVDFMEHYAVPPERPIRVTVPTRGVFAEAIQGSCNSCERIDDTRLWRFDESPIPDSPVPPSPLSTDSLVEVPADPKPTPAPSPIINIQSAPSLPDPLGLSNVFSLLAKSNLFKDVTGLKANQEAALGAFEAALETAKSFGSMASSAVLQQDLARDIGRTLDTAAKARDAGLLTQEQASSVAVNALRNLIGDPPATEGHPIDDATVGEAVNRAADAETGSVTVQSPGERIEVSFAGGDGEEVTIGASPVPATGELQRWIKMKIYHDLNAATGMVPIMDIPDVAAFESLMWTGHAAAAKDESWKRLEAFGWLRKNPKNSAQFHVGLRSRLTIPGKTASSKSPSGKGKVPLVVIAHGNHLTFDVAALRIPPSYRGYGMLQDELAKLGIASISLDSNLPNWMNEGVELRAQMIIEAVKDLRNRTLAKGDPLRNRIDFDNVIFVGHSRGGEAVVRAAQINQSGPGKDHVILRAVCTLAPTDFLGGSKDFTGAPRVPNAHALDPLDTDFLLGLWGSLDGDVMGADGALSAVGGPFRHYARATCAKAHVYFDKLAHNRFNSVWVDNSFAGSDDPFLRPVDKPSLRSAIEHQTLLTEYVVAVARWKFLNDLAATELLDGRTANSLGVTTSMLHQFGDDIAINSSGLPVSVAAMLVADSFETPLMNDLGGIRTLASADGVLDFNTAVGHFSAPNSPPRVMTHIEGAVYIPFASATAAPSVSTELGSAGTDVSSFTFLEFDLAVIGNVTTEASTNALPLPTFEVSLTDTAGLVEVIPSLSLFAHRSPSRPRFHAVGGGVNITLCKFETIRAALGGLAIVDLTSIASVEIVGAAHAAQVLIDNIRFVNEVTP